MNNKITFFKKILSFLPFLNNFARKIYKNFTNAVYFVPFKKGEVSKKIISSKFYRFNLKNFEKFKKDNDFFLITKNKNIQHYSIEKFDKIKNLIEKNEGDAVYDGDDPFDTEISSKNIIEFYFKNYPKEIYPRRFFYFRDKFKVLNIGAEHRSYNFNASFTLPSGGRSIGDGGPVENRLQYIPDLTDKSFLDIGSEEGYAVFNAIKKNAKSAKGLNINEVTEYDYFPNDKRPKSITPRRREEIDRTQQFLLKEFKFENKNVKFEYNNIYKLGEEQFDFVFCFGVLYHLKNPYLALENLFKITNETLVLETQGIKNTNYLNAKISLDDGFIRHSSKSLKYLLERVGFRKVEILLDAYDSKTLNEFYDGSTNIQNIVLKASK
jgi:SAM-dependent methyltransferase